MYGKNQLLTVEPDLPQRIWIQRIFATIQGEGPSAGTPAVFIRLGGCSLQCYFCDTDFESSTWKPTPDEILDTVKGHFESWQRSGRPRPLVVLTGGEPLRVNLRGLLERLLQHGFPVEIETAGIHMWEWIPRLSSRGLRIICSPKTDKVAEGLEMHITAYKYIIRYDALDPDDGLPSESTQRQGIVQRIFRPPDYRPATSIFVQPCEDSDPAMAWKDRVRRNVAHRQAAVQSALTYGYRLSLQTHKFLALP